MTQHLVVSQHFGITDADLDGQINEYVNEHPNASLYHTPRWVNFASNVFHFDKAWLVAREQNGQLAGVLPLVLQSSLLFGHRWVSLPFFNYGGPIARNSDIERQLIAASADISHSGGSRTVEIRDFIPREGIAARTEKATLLLDLPPDTDTLGKALGAKLRSQIRRADRESPSVHIGGPELLPEFFSVFARTMRDLGTPVYPIEFFSRMLQEVGSDCNVLVIRLGNRAAAAALLTRWRSTVEVPWAASRHDLRSTSVNMRLYWECLAHSIRTGATRFDFGRSTIDSGTYRFKLQWGAQPRPLYWYYPRHDARTAIGADNSQVISAVRRAWTYLPISVANLAGRLLSPGLPW